eukprot:5059657-Amphidinium_carterae.3
MGAWKRCREPCAAHRRAPQRRRGRRERSLPALAMFCPQRVRSRSPKVPRAACPELPESSFFDRRGMRPRNIPREKQTPIVSQTGCSTPRASFGAPNTWASAELSPLSKPPVKRSSPPISARQAQHPKRQELPDPPP